MLKQRVITAAILIPIFLCFYFYSPLVWFTRIVAIITLFAAYEWARLCGWVQVYQKILYVFLMFFLMTLALIIPVKWILLAGCAFWMMVFFYLCYIQYRFSIEIPGVIRAILGVLVLIPTWISICFSRAEFGALGILLFVIVALADSAAYFAGKRFGLHLLASRISPKKTWEGLLGALLSVMILTLIVAICKRWEIAFTFKMLLITQGLALISVEGDLFESAMKRLAGVKDSGSLLKGHGGILDRIDGMCSAAPFFALLSYWL